MPRLPVRPRGIPHTGNRTAVWIVAQLHILFAGIHSGAPIFVGDFGMAGLSQAGSPLRSTGQEVTKVTVIPIV